MVKAANVAKLTKRVVDAAPVDKNRRYVIWDADLAGFGLRVEPSGRKTFVARYRAGGGRSGVLRQETIGRLGTLTPDQARAKAKKTLGAAASGGDPVGAVQAARQKGITVAEICDWYLKETGAGRLLGRKGRPIKASTLSTDRMRINAHVVPLLGSKSVQSLGLRDIEQMQADIAAGKTSAKTPKSGKRKRGGIASGGAGTAGRTLGMLRTIFEHAVRRGMVTVNPAKGARKFADGKRKKRLSLDEIRKFGAAMRTAAADGENPTALAAIRLILLTGFRRSEALGIRREWVMPGGGVDFPDTKSGPQARPIGRAAMKLLNARLRKSNEAWAFPGDRGDGHFVGLPKALARVSALAGPTGITAHVLRHTFASVAAELGYSELVIAGLLGHSAGSVTSGYVHLDAALVTAADRVSATIADALDGKAGAKVIPLRAEVR
ncbi:MAG TPA: site-specific integrase [Bauldia sp.]